MEILDEIEELFEKVSTLIFLLTTALAAAVATSDLSGPNII